LAPLEHSQQQVTSLLLILLLLRRQETLVTGSDGGPYYITNGSNGAQTALLGSSVSLTPTSSVSIATSQTGTADLPQIQYVEVLQNPIALQDTWTAYPAATATVSRIQGGNGTQNEIQQITLGNNVYAGAFIVNFGSKTSNPIQWNASPTAVQTALQAMSSIGSGNVIVGGSAGSWVVTFTGSLALASQTLMTTVATGLVGPLALIGTLSLNTAAIEEAIGETNSTSQTFAIQVTPSGGSPFTVLQEPITIYNDLIVGAPSVPAPGVSYYTTTESDARYLAGTGDGTGLHFPGTLSIASGKTLTASNTVTLAGTDGHTLNIGTGGTLGTGAYAAAYTLPDATTSILGGMKVGSGLLVSSGTVSVGIGSSVEAWSPTLDALAAISFDPSVLAVFPYTTNSYSGLVALDGSGNLLYPLTSVPLADTSANLWYANSTLLADASGNLYSNLTTGEIIVSGGTNSPVTSIAIGTTSGTIAAGDDARITGALQNTYGVASGTNTYTATLSPVPDSYTTGFITTITFPNANTGASTLNLNSLGAIAIQLNSAALTGGEIVAGSTKQLVYDGTQFQIIT